MELLVPWCHPTCPSQRFAQGTDCDCGGWEREFYYRYYKELEAGFKHPLPILGCS